MNKKVTKAELLSIVLKVWLNNPQLRLCQLIESAIPTDYDPYFVKDGELMNFLKEYDKNEV
ncbi:MAG: hypothetical protein ACOC1K_01160 [Nanoarchaeota archaeon]